MDKGTIMTKDEILNKLHQTRCSLISFKIEYERGREGHVEDQELIKNLAKRVGVELPPEELDVEFVFTALRQLETYLDLLEVSSYREVR